MGLPRAKSVDDYIASASATTRPILIELRRIFQKSSPKLVESIKWNVPCYEYNGPVGGFAAFKHHVTWGLWKASLLNDPDKLIGHGILKGGKITSLAEMPAAAALTDLIRQAITLNDAGIKPVTPDPEIPADFAAAMKHVKIDRVAVGDHWKAFTPARRWQYVNWITTAKRPETRANRIAEAIEAIAQGKTMK